MIRRLIAAMLLTAFNCILLPAASEPDISLIGTINVPGNQIDRSGLHHEVQPGVWHDLFGGISALAYTGRGNLYVALPDRGPKDGAVDWTCRFHLVRINPKTSQWRSLVPCEIQRTTLMTGSLGKRFSGGSTVYQETATDWGRLDPEGIRVGKDGTYWISEEYGPHVLQFSESGQLLNRFEVPEKFLIENPGPNKKTENANNESGRQGNRGMEGLAISDDGNLLFGLMQSPLLQDCERNEAGKPSGLNCRLLQMNIQSGDTTEYLYQLDNKKNKLNEILSMGNGQFLVIERDGNVGEAAQFKKIMKIDINSATPIDQIDALPHQQIPANTIAVQKEVFIDLLDPRFELTGTDMPEKIESLAFGPRLDDGRRLLLVASDNDFNKSWSTKIFCFAIGPTNDSNEKLTSR